ncbi:MAG: peptidyl-prolyl cis-trans isomerase [Candidatus Sabulitectum sp.]|nr:peptidyl-prolyl cis-trans isomerase [Candidatus Sabulitectum sp.]
MLKYFLLPALLMIISCGTPDGSNWLIKTSTSEVTVSEAGIIWDELDQSERALLLAGDSPVGDFVSALGRETMILHEISNDRYLHSPTIEYMRKCWVRSASAKAYNDSLSASVQGGITATDLSNYRELLGKIVWYSSTAREGAGPVRLPDLPWDLAFAFDTMTTGSTVEIEGVSYTLDSCITSPEKLIDEAHPDTDRVNTFALSSLTQSRVNRNLLSLKTEAMGTFSIDSASVLAYCAHRDSLEDRTELAFWNNGAISAEEFDGIVAFIALGQSNAASSPRWVYRNLKNQAELIIVEELYSRIYPHDYADIQQAANKFATDQAYELLFRHNVTNSVVITDSMVIEAYSSMDSIPMVPETRTFISIAASSTVCEEVLARLNSGDSLFLSNYSGYSRFLIHGNNLLSRPVSVSELPSEISAVLFGLNEVDTGWYGPSEIDEDLFIAYRLDQIFPAHPTPFEKLRESIRHRLLIHCEEQRTMEWICELERACNLQINNGILGDLPADPSSWSDL